MEPKKRSGSLEEEFFAKENAQLLEQLRRKTEKEEKKELLRQVVQIQDDEFLERLLVLGIGPEKVIALRLIPLVAVAWADGQLDDRERQAILDAAEQRGLTSQSVARKLLESWLTRQPKEDLLALWKSYVGGLWDRFSIDDQLKMRQSMLQAARDVAESAGGFLGLTSKISAAEREILDELDKVLS